MTSDFNYKKYSLEKLEEWMHDAMSAGEATPQEIYDVIKGVVEENYYTYKHQASQAYELLGLLNGNGKGHFICDKDDSSPECEGAWNNFWDSEEVSDDCMPPWGHSDLEYLCKNNNKNEIWDSGQITDELMETIKREGYDYTPIDSKKRWILPIEEVENGDTIETEYFVTFPDDLLEASNLKQGDDVEWVDNNDGTFLLRKIEKTLNHDEAIAAGWTMTADGFWIKE